MDILEAKKIVVEAGKQLVSSGLIARTWGNVSCRISDTQFVITPSGRDYISLTPDDIVQLTFMTSLTRATSSLQVKRVFMLSAIFTSPKSAL